MSRSKEENKIYHAAYYQRNKERLKERSRNYGREKRAATPEKVLAYQQEWRHKNRKRLQPLWCANQRRRYADNPEKFRRAAKNYRDAFRVEMLQAYGGICACCAESEPAFLTLEHKNRDGKAHRELVGNTPTAVYRDLRNRNWPKDDYELLCYNCNNASWKLGICPHRAKEKQTI